MNYTSFFFSGRLSRPRNVSHERVASLSTPTEFSPASALLSPTSRDVAQQARQHTADEDYARRLQVTIQCTLVVLPPFGPNKILAIYRGNNLNRNNITFGKMDLEMGGDKQGTAIKEGRYKEGGLNVFNQLNNIKLEKYMCLMIRSCFNGLVDCLIV